MATALWGRHPGGDAYVVGTGTSLAGFDFARLAGRLTIALNDAVTCPGLDPAYHLFHDHGLWKRYHRLALAERTHVVCSRHSREAFLADARCAFRARVWQYESSGTPTCEAHDTRLYVDRTIATAGIQLAWKLGARRVFLLGVDGYKLRAPDGRESYYWTGAAKPPEKRAERRVGELVVQDRHDKWIENMRALRRFFTKLGLFPCDWPGPGVYNLSARSTIDAWPKRGMEETLTECLKISRVGEAAISPGS